MFYALRRAAWSVMFCVAALFPNAAAQAGTVRVLLIGNGVYDHFKDNELKLTSKDVKKIGEAIKHLEPAAIIQPAGENLRQSAMLEAVALHLAGLQNGDTSIFVFSGHGTEIEGHSYLLPTDIIPSALTSSSALNRNALGLGKLLEMFHEKTRDRNIAGVFIIDACRSSLVQPRGRSLNADQVAGVQAPTLEADGGLAAADPPPGSIVLYSAATKQVALETLNANDKAETSVYTRKLLELLAAPNILHVPVEHLAKQLRWNVFLLARNEAGHTQTPAYLDEMLEQRNILGSSKDVSTPYEKPDVKPVRQAAAANQGGSRTKSLGLPVIIKDCDQCPELVEIPKGHFDIGTTDADVRGDASERPQTRINIDHRFAMGRFDISRSEWLACQADQAYGKCRVIVKAAELGSSLRKPITDVSWHDAQAYIIWLNQLLETNGNKAMARYRLPSEAEFEYAARAGSQSAYAFGDDPADLCPHANGADASLKSILWTNTLCKDGHGREAAQIDSYLPNAFGLHSMHGNVWKWTADCWAQSHSGIDITGKARAGSCSARVVRGGSWRSGPAALRSARRIAFNETHTRGTLGFRIALDLDEAR